MEVRSTPRVYQDSSSVDKPRALALEPLFGRVRLALRTAALMARVIERALHVPFRTAAHVSAEIGGATVADPVRGAMHVRRQPMLLRVAFEMCLKDLLERAFHVLRNARAALTAVLPMAVALAPPAEPGSCNEK